MNREPVLTVKDLTVAFESNGKDIEITDKVSFNIRHGEVFGLVGESGCGKTVTSLALLKLLPMPGGKVLSGRILLNGKDLLSLSSTEIRKVRGRDITMIFQEPGTSMNPLLTVERQLMECFDYHDFNGDKEARVRVLLRQVGFTDIERVLHSFPHELSGGMLQRVMITMALIMSPTLIIADEPTTALDVTVQAQIMELLLDMKDKTDTSILLITHNLGLIAQHADRLAVMYAGRIVEEADVDIFFREPLHPYSRGLLNAIPRLESGSEMMPIRGQVPQPIEYLTGCRFRDRCRNAFDLCDKEPQLEFFDNSHRVACFLYQKGNQ